jgi:TonB family protein
MKKQLALAFTLAAGLTAGAAHAQLGLQEGAPAATTSAAGGNFKASPVVDQYKTAVAKHVLGYHKYAGSKAGYRNLTVVGYTVDRKGAVSDTWVVRSSGDQHLDERAVSTFKKALAAPLPTPPAALFGSDPVAHFSEAFVHTSDGGYKLQTLLR